MASLINIIPVHCYLSSHHIKINNLINKTLPKSQQNKLVKENNHEFKNAINQVTTIIVQVFLLSTDSKAVGISEGKVVMNKFIIICLFTIILLGCSSSNPINRQQGDNRQTSPGMELNWLVARMTDQLMENRSLSTAIDPTAISAFVDLDTLQDTNWMGQQLQESFIHELTHRGLVIVDFKLTGSIKVTPQGDFALSRNYRDLAARLPISRILVGTFSRNSQGILVNARIVDMRTKIVISTAQSLIPQQYLSGANNSFGRRVAANPNRGYLMRDNQPRVGSTHLVSLIP